MFAYSHKRCVKKDGSIFYKHFLVNEDRALELRGLEPAAQAALDKKAEGHYVADGIDVDLTGADIREALTEATEFEPARPVTWAGMPCYQVYGIKADFSKATWTQRPSTTIVGL
ncbi:MAG: hypothetical protein P3A28_09015 [Gemmatimonadota bacterium]|nr:hypothetical protein [Gemmatimonadota bacterium]